MCDTLPLSPSSCKSDGPNTDMVAVPPMKACLTCIHRFLHLLRFLNLNPEKEKVRCFSLKKTFGLPPDCNPSQTRTMPAGHKAQRKVRRVLFGSLWPLGLTNFLFDQGRLTQMSVSLPALQEKWRCIFTAWGIESSDPSPYRIICSSSIANRGQDDCPHRMLHCTQCANK